LYKGISDRPLGWKARRQIKPRLGQVARDANVKKWEGATRHTSDWDGLRRVSPFHRSFDVTISISYEIGQLTSIRILIYGIPMETVLSIFMGKGSQGEDQHLKYLSRSYSTLTVTSFWTDVLIRNLMLPPSRIQVAMTSQTTLDGLAGQAAMNSTFRHLPRLNQGKQCSIILPLGISLLGC
jgi:hypothetical protein